jgi:protein transport protein SEC23
VDFQTKQWTCPFSYQRNNFPPHYAQAISETNLPAELVQQYTTVEYELPGRFSGPPVFLFVVDTCFHSEEDLEPLKDALHQSLAFLPETARVGLISFGKMVQVHEVGVADISKSYSLRGNKTYSPAQVSEMLGLIPRGRRRPGQPVPTPAEAAARFLLPVDQAQYAMEQILEDLQTDPWPVKSGFRPERCTGAALGVAVSLLESTVKTGARIMLFTSGPVTHGPGRIAAEKYTEQMRSRNDIDKNNKNAELMAPALKYYEGLADRCVANGHCVDVFACNLDQVGLLEQMPMISKTGGVCVMGDSFNQSVFKDSFKKMFEPGPDGFLNMGFNAKMEVLTSPEIKICGVLGSCASLRKGGKNVSATVIGEGGTNTWAISALDPNSTLGFVFEVAQASGKTIPQGRCPHVQFITTYQHPSGCTRMRVTTTRLQWAAAIPAGQKQAPSARQSVISSFDQETAVALMARIAVWRAEHSGDTIADVLRWLDRSLIRMCTKFATYEKDKPETFALPHELTLYPQFMFHLRRSPFLQVFNSSPDETAYYRQKLMCDTTSNVLVMVQPSLLCYSFAGPPTPVFLDSESVKADVILLLDTFFQVVIFHGSTIASWRDQGYQNRADHANFKHLLAAPVADAETIMDNRFPVPRYIICDQGKSQGRFLLAKLNPSRGESGDSSEVIFTDDVSLRVFMQHLIKLSVSSS